ncbi:MAG: phospho-sugar mutase [Actinomycetota bacterium]
MNSRDEIECISQAHEWLAHDPDPETRNEIKELLATGQKERIQELFRNHLQFGTAGLRGSLGPGPNRMNQVTVRRLAYGISAYLKPQSTVVVGYDARQKSKVFARDICDILNAHNIAVCLFPRFIPTPVLAYAVRHLKTDLGIMITASHNPASDNGCKIFLNDGAQLRAPIDQEIETLMQSSSLPPMTIPEAKEITTILDDGVWQSYCERIASSVDRGSSELRIAYTPLHGVAWDTINSVFTAADSGQLIPVKSQVEPDPDFPTTSFPNPEEEGLMDILIDLAFQTEADLAMENDPDGDRLAAAIPTRNGDWRTLSGDEIGALLFDRLAEKTSGNTRKVVSTIVCSSLVPKIATAKDINHEETLTGFKWIIPEAYRNDSETPIFCYEEALGYATTEAVRDKDGIAAALLLAEVLANCQKNGKSILEKLEEFSLQYGHHVTTTRRVRFKGTQPDDYLQSAMQGLRERPPSEFSVGEVTSVTDYLRSNEHSSLPLANLVKLEIGKQVRVLVRPSGTEPMIKIYMEMVTSVSESSQIAMAEIQAIETLDVIGSEIEILLRKYVSGT